MKTLYLSIIVLFTVASSSGLAYAEQPLLDFYNNSQLVLVGKVISLSQVPSTTNNPSQSPNQTRYDIQVEQYYKNPQDAKLITVYGYGKGIYLSQDPTYDIGDRVFLYVNQENGHYQIQPNSFVLHNDCDARPMIPLSTLPFESPPISAPAYAHIFDFQNDMGTSSNTFLIGNKIHISFVAENYLPVAKYATLIFTIKTENNTNLIFNDTKQIAFPSCYSKTTVSWDFIPKSSGTYFVNVNMSGSMSLGTQTILLFTDPSLTSSFDVRENMAGGTIDKAHYSPSPLQQFKSGIAANDVKCSDGFSLVIKSEDGSPACVKPDTGQKLIERGWASSYTNMAGKESISLSAFQGESHESFYDNGTVASNFTINVNIKNFRPSNTSLVLQVYYNDGILYKTVNVPSDTIQSDGFYKYDLTAVSDKNHPPPFKVVATYNNETAVAYALVFAHP